MPREMKDSGIEWIGNIPLDWKIIKIGNVYSERRIKVSDLEYMPLSVTMKGIMSQLSTAAKSDDHDNRKLVKIGDFAINSRSDRRGSCGISPYEGSVSLINTVLCPKSNMNSHYYNWLFHSTMFSDEFYKWGHGIVNDLWTTNWNDMKKIFIPYPSIDEQQKIANFLDEKVGEIDRVIAKTKESIEEYKKYRQSIISTSVTKGIDSNVTLKDSKVDWIGEIPKHWSIDKIKYSAKIRNEKYNDTLGALDYFGLENIESWSNKYFKTDSIYDLNGSQICKKDDLVFGKLRPYLSKVYKVNYDRCCSSEFAVIYDFKGSIDYLMYLMSSLSFIDYINMSTYGTKMPRANIEFIKNSFIPLPSLEEQLRIVEFIQNKVKSIDELLNLKNSYIVQLEQYKKSLIYEYVTGKKEVR